MTAHGAPDASVPDSTSRTTCWLRCGPLNESGSTRTCTWSRCPWEKSCTSLGTSCSTHTFRRTASCRCCTCWRTAHRQRSPSWATRALLASRCSWAVIPRHAGPCVQSAGHAYRLSGQVLREEFHGDGAIRLLLLRYTQALITQMAQTVVCNRHHSVDQQLCRWLLLALDRLPSNELTMTQELIAHLLGVRREGVTAAVGKLQRLEVIRPQPWTHHGPGPAGAGTAELRMLRGGQARDRSPAALSARPLRARLRSG